MVYGQLLSKDREEPRSGVSWSQLVDRVSKGLLVVRVGCGLIISFWILVQSAKAPAEGMDFTLLLSFLVLLPMVAKATTAGE